MLIFACLSIVAAIAMAWVRQRKGIFGKHPERKETPEWRKPQQTISKGEQDAGSCTIHGGRPNGTVDKGVEHPAAELELEALGAQEREVK